MVPYLTPLSLQVEGLGDVASSPRFSFAREPKGTVGPTNKSFETLYSSDGTQYAKTSVGRMETKRWSEITVPQRLLAAIITEDDIERIENDLGESNLQLTSDYVHYGSNSHVNEHPAHLSNMDCQLELEDNYQNNSMGYGGLMTSSNFRQLNIQNFMSCDESAAEKNTMLNSYNGSLSDYQKSDLNHLQIVDNPSPYECQFEDMPVANRMLMELRSVGLLLDAVVCIV